MLHNIFELGVLIPQSLIQNRQNYIRISTLIMYLKKVSIESGFGHIFESEEVMLKRSRRIKESQRINCINNNFINQ